MVEKRGKATLTEKLMFGHKRKKIENEENEK